MALDEVLTGSTQSPELMHVQVRLEKCLVSWLLALVSTPPCPALTSFTSAEDLLHLFCIHAIGEDPIPADRISAHRKVRVSQCDSYRSTLLMP